MMSSNVDVIPYIVYVMLNIYWVQCHIYKGCDIMESLGVSHRYSGWDGTNIVNMFLYTMDMYVDIYRG